MIWERLYAIHGFHDRPRSGVADYGGQPHFFECEFSEALDDYTEKYLLSPIDSELLAFVVEHWAIWIRWREAFHRGEVTIEQHPALDEDRERYEAIAQAIGDRLKIVPEKAQAMKATFRWPRPNPGRDEGEVQWRPFADHEQA